MSLDWDGSDIARIARQVAREEVAKAYERLAEILNDPSPLVMEKTPKQAILHGLDRAAAELRQ